MGYASKALEFEAAHPEQCLRLHYEELVTDPESSARRMFEFIGVAPAPGITGSALLDQESREIFGYGDHKIRASNQISDRSIGRGIRIPPVLVPPTQLVALNKILECLGYVQVDRDWQMSTFPPPLLIDSGEVDADQPASQLDEDAEDAENAEDDMLAARFDGLDDAITARISRNLERLPAVFGKWRAVGIVAYSASSPRIGQAWRIDCGKRELESDLDVAFESLDVDWVYTGELDAWLSVIDGAENISNALRNGYIRDVCTEMVGDGPLDDVRGEGGLRIRMMTHLLELGGQSPPR